MAWIRRLSSAMLALGCAVVATWPSAQPSFDCAKATTRSERAICANADLAALDWKLGSIFIVVRDALTKEARQDFVDQQRDWLRHRTELCETPWQTLAGPEIDLRITSCLIQAYQKRLAQLEPFDEKAPPPADISGKWMFVSAEGGMVIERLANNRYKINIDTASGPTFHACNVEASDVDYVNGIVSFKIEEIDYMVKPPRPGMCEVSIVFKGQQAVVKDSFGACRSFCGARGHFSGRYKLEN